MAKKKEPEVAGQKKTLDMENLRRRLDLLDDRFDNIDSMVTAVAERVMNQPITLNITCPNCGKNVEVTILGRGKPTI